MTEGKPDERSQPIFRVPRDKTPAEMTLDDGERSYVLLFVVPGGDSIAQQVFEDTSAFMPVIQGSSTRLVARKAVACVTVHQLHAHVDDSLLHERLQVRVGLRGGTTVRGELRWSAPPDRRRTLDCLNDCMSFLLVWDAQYIHYIAKTSVVSVEESA